MQLLMQRYEEALRKGSVPSAVPRPIRVQRRFEPRAQSAVATSRNGSNGSLRDEQENIGARRPVMMAKKPMSTPSKPTVNAGVVTEEEVRRNFGDVPKITISNRNDIRTHLEEARIVLERTDVDWSKRNNSLKMIRAVVQNGGMDFENDLITSLLQLEEALVKSVTDLRSQVCKEACTTVCLLSERLGTKLNPLFERILPQCIPIIQNSAKVMSSSSQQACDFMVKNVQSPRILQAILDQTSHKSKDIRAHCHYLVYLALQNWPQHKLEKHVKELTNAVKNAVNDADPKARKNGRDSYLQLEITFPNQAQALFKSLDPSKQKTLSGGASAASSAQSIQSLRDGMPFTKRPGTTGLSRPSAFLSGRSASAIDTSSAKLAAVSSPRYPANRMPVTPNRSGGTLRGSMTSSIIKTRPSVTPLRSNMSNSSQPSSRNGSPTRLHKRLPPQPAIPRPSTTTPTTHNNGFHHEDSEELFSKISNLTLQSTFGEDEDFLLGSNPSSPGSQLSIALKKSSSNDATEKKDGLRILYDILRTSRSSETDIKKIYDALMKYIMEGNHKLLSLVCDTVCEMVTRYPDSFGAPQLLTLVSRLISKSSSELIPTNQTIWKRMLTEVRTSFQPDDLLVAICKFIDGSMTAPQTTKAKSQTVQYLCELVTHMEVGSNINRLEVKCALAKIFVWLEDSKNQDIRPHFEKLMAALFNTNQAQFASILSSFKPEWKNLGFQLCQKENQRKESIELSPIVRDSPSVFSGIDMSDNFRRNQSPSLGPILNNSVESDGNRSNLDVTAHLGTDAITQNAYIKKQLSELAMAKSHPQRQDEQILAMQQLLQMITEGSFTTWDENFKPLIVQLFDLLTLDDIKVKKEALRLLIRLCTVQASRFYDYGQMTVTKVLATTYNEKDNYFLNVVDECLKTLAIHLPIPMTLATLNPIIATKSDPRITFALKMIQRMIEEWKHDDLQNYLHDFVPGVIQCYNCEDSSIRKNTIFCLVPLVNKFGREVMGQYLIRLESKGQKLLDVYLTRTQTASTHF